jgi:predicted transcriptional regulator
MRGSSVTITERPVVASLTLAEVRRLLDAEVVWCPDGSVPVTGCAAADLMSDVLTASRPGMVLLTGLVSVQAIRTAAIADLAGVVFVQGKKPGDEIIALAREKNVPVLATSRPMFEAAGVLFGAVGLPATERLDV